MRRIINEILGVKWSKKLKNAPFWQWKQSMHWLFWFWASLILFFWFVHSNCMVFWFSICCSLRWIPLLKTWIFQTTWTTFNQHQLVSKHYSWWFQFLWRWKKVLWFLIYHNTPKWWTSWCIKNVNFHYSLVRPVVTASLVRFVLVFCHWTTNGR